MTSALMSLAFIAYSFLAFKIASNALLYRVLSNISSKRFFKTAPSPSGQLQEFLK
jgi:hypothetical protein